jgi:AcrR family transcriptional regulator
VPYPAGHRLAVRQKIVASARRLFNRHGFDNVSVKQIMAGAGLTHGGFYSYFKGKSALYTEVLGCFFTEPNWKNHWRGVEVDLAAVDAGSQIVRAYLSRQHFEDVENSCPMVALPTDVRRSGRAVRGAFEAVFEAMVIALEKGMEDKSATRHSKAQAIAALCIGGLIVARAMSSSAAADDLRFACRNVALELGSWKRARPSRGERRGSSRSQRTVPPQSGSEDRIPSSRRA